MNAKWYMAMAYTIRIGNTVELYGIIQEVTAFVVMVDGSVSINDYRFERNTLVDVYRVPGS